jgi:hypothetical protein
MGREGFAFDRPIPGEFLNFFGIVLLPLLVCLGTAVQLARAARGRWRGGRRGEMVKGGCVPRLLPAGAIGAAIKGGLKIVTNKQE